MDKDSFIEKYCNNCGTQRCEGPDSIWFQGCVHNKQLAQNNDCILLNNADSYHPCNGELNKIYE